MTLTTPPLRRVSKGRKALATLGVLAACGMAASSLAYFSDSYSTGVDRVNAGHLQIDAQAPATWLLVDSNGVETPIASAADARPVPGDTLIRRQGAVIDAGGAHMLAYTQFTWEGQGLHPAFEALLDANTTTSYSTTAPNATELDPGVWAIDGPGTTEFQSEVVISFPADLTSEWADTAGEVAGTFTVSQLPFEAVGARMDWEPFALMTASVIEDASQNPTISSALEAQLERVFRDTAEPMMSNPILRLADPAVTIESFMTSIDTAALFNSLEAAIDDAEARAAMQQSVDDSLISVTATLPLEVEALVVLTPTWVNVGGLTVTVEGTLGDLRNGGGMVDAVFERLPGLEPVPTSLLDGVLAPVISAVETALTMVGPAFALSIDDELPAIP